MPCFQNSDLSTASTIMSGLRDHDPQQQVPAGVLPDQLLRQRQECVLPGTVQYNIVQYRTIWYRTVHQGCVLPGELLRPGDMQGDLQRVPAVLPPGGHLPEGVLQGRLLSEDWLLLKCYQYPRFYTFNKIIRIIMIHFPFSLLNVNVDYTNALKILSSRMSVFMNN